MKARRMITISILSVAMIGFSTFAIFKQIEPVRAQDQLPPPVGDRVSFGLVGITSGQTVRISVANTIMPNDSGLPPGPTRVLMSFRGMNGQLIRNRSGEVIRRAVDLERGDSAFLDLDYDALPPGPVRIQLRPVVVRQPPPVNDTGQNVVPPDGTVPAVEIINNANGRTQFAVFTHPGVARGFNPQPDPPSPE